MTAAIKNTKLKQPLGITAYHKIYRNIMTLAFEPGQRLEEKQLMDALDIGRTPIREALQRLTADFMVESHHNKGFIVRPITVQNTKAAFAALKIMEQGVAALAVRQDVSQFIPLMVDSNDTVQQSIRKNDVLGLVEANSLFHQYFAHCSRNDYLIHGLHKVRCETNRLAYLSFSNEIDPLRSLPDHYASVVAQHETIIDCLKTRNDTRLKKTLREHTQAFQNRILLYMSS